VVFFYFDKQRPDSVLSSAVWRAVLMQLLHTLPSFDPDIIDMFLLFRENRTGQPMASDNEVFSMLSLLVQRLDRLVLVVDGIDECQDQMSFWNRLGDICDGPAAASVALFSRPTVTIPPRLMRRTAVLAMHNALNLGSIRAFLRPRIMSIVDCGLMGQAAVHRNWEATVDEVARRANGMFLWATLFVEYLQSPHISIRGRHEALNNLNRLEGLDLIYRAILRTLVQRPGSARDNTVQAFEFVLYSIRPLHVTELWHAIAVPMDRAVEPDDLIPDFHRNLGSLSGALMELDSNGFVRFIHLSIVEYLADARRMGGSGQDLPPEVATDRSTGHASLACRCLSYLYHTVKGQPLSGSSREVPEYASQVKKHPLLDYATEFWSHHVLECMEAFHSSSAGQMVKTMVQLASNFLSTKGLVTVWIEASWVFKRPPQIRHGPDDPFLKESLRMPAHLDSNLAQAWRAASSTLRQLSGELAMLNTSWAHVLQNEPNEIWEPSISAFHQSPFWQRIPGARITARFEAESDPNHRSICLKTRLSPDGRYLGLVRLYIPVQDSTRFIMFFERWSINPNVKLQEVNLNILRSCLKPFVSAMHKQRITGGGPVIEFQCPAAITADLGRVAAPGCVVHIPVVSDDNQQRNSLDDTTQFIDFSGTSCREGPFRFRIEDFELGYDIQLSDTGQYLMTVQKSNGIVDVQQDMGCHLRLITLYEDANWGKRLRPAYRHVASLAFKPNYLRPAVNSALEDEDREGIWCALLHPRYPAVAIKYQRFIVCRNGRVIERGQGRSADETGLALWNFDASTAGN
jgi:hypothetical protein